MKSGTITPHGVALEKHESDTIVFFTSLGRNIELIPPSNIPHAKKADFIMENLEWEMKSPESATEIVVERAFHKALQQSPNVVIDLRRAKGKCAPAVEHLRKCFANSQKSQRLYIITKRRELLDHQK